MTVGNVSLFSSNFRYINLLTLEENPMNVSHVTKPEGGSFLMKIRRALILEKNIMNLSNVGYPSEDVITLETMEDFVLQRNLLQVSVC
jgi:hypothetical protein